MGRPADIRTSPEDKQREALEDLRRFFGICESSPELYREIIERMPIDLKIRLKVIACECGISDAEAIVNKDAGGE
jgi:hypothetical protein